MLCLSYAPYATPVPLGKMMTDGPTMISTRRSAACGSGCAAGFAVAAAALGPIRAQCVQRFGVRVSMLVLATIFGAANLAATILSSAATSSAMGTPWIGHRPGCGVRGVGAALWSGDPARP